MKLYYRILLTTCITVSSLFAAIDVQVISESQETLELELNIDVISPGDLVPYFFNIGIPDEDYPALKTRFEGKREFKFASRDKNTPEVIWAGKQMHRGLNVASIKVTPWSDEGFYYERIIISLTFTKLKSNDRNIYQEDQILSQKIINWKSAKNWIKSRSLLKKTSTEIPGKWFNFKITQNGIFAISGQALSELDPVFNDIDPSRIHIYTNSKFGKSQGNTYYNEIPDNLVSVKYSLSVGGNLSPDTKLIFYGAAHDGYHVNQNEINYYKNPYFKENNYWLFLPDDPSIVSNQIEIFDPPVEDGLSISNGYIYLHYENDLVNPFKSGIAWVGESVSSQGIKAIEMDIRNVSPSGNATLEYSFLGGNSSLEADSNPQNNISIHLGTSQSSSLTRDVWYGYYFKTGTVDISGEDLANNPPRFIIRNNATSPASEPMIDFLDLRYESELTYTDQDLTFYPPPNVGGIFTINIESEKSLEIWNVYDPANPVVQSSEWSSGVSFFKTILSPDTLRKFVAFDPEDLPEIETLIPVPDLSFGTLRNSDISAKHIILGPEKFKDAASELIDHRGNSVYASMETVYNEFSGGNIDPFAIKNFLQWALENWQEPLPETVFILGDADYDYKNLTGRSNISVPTIEFGTTNSYASDDFLATIYGPIPEIAIGRLPVSTADEVSNYIKKIIKFEKEPEFGFWRQKVTLVADDGARPEPRHGSIYVGKSHTINSETLGNIVPEMVRVNKFYLLDYPEVSDASSYGVVKPAATEDLLKLLESGTAIINYIGHGSEHQWAQEKLLVQDRDLSLINTGMKLPLWIAGTCSWGHFDDMDARSFAEDLISLEMNGASGIITTTRAISVSGNAQYTTDLFEAFFPNGNVADLPVGILLQSIKTPYRESRYFQLFGDPAMAFIIPNDTISINSVSPDTLETLQTGEFTGKQTISFEGGTGYIIVQDAKKRVTREYNISSTTESLSYILSGNDLFRGQIDIEGKVFSGNIRIPLDISYSNEPGKLMIYFVTDDEPVKEALGFKGGINFKGGTIINDDQGPIISIETQTGRQLRSGDHAYIDDELYIKLADPIGINTANEIGHEITLTNLETNEQSTLTEDFTYDRNSITSGKIPIPEIGNNEILSIKVKAWDSANNPNEKEFTIYLEEKEDLKLFQVYNFPNPFSKHTRFQFEITQNAEVFIEIFTTNGRKIYETDKTELEAGTHLIEWDGLDAFGEAIANGVYLYRVKAKGENETVSFIGQIAKLR